MILNAILGRTIVQSNGNVQSARNNKQMSLPKLKLS